MHEVNVNLVKQLEASDIGEAVAEAIEVAEESGWTVLTAFVRQLDDDELKPTTGDL